MGPLSEDQPSWPRQSGLRSEQTFSPTSTSPIQLPLRKDQMSGIDNRAIEVVDAKSQSNPRDVVNVSRKANRAKNHSQNSQSRQTRTSALKQHRASVPGASGAVRDYIRQSGIGFGVEKKQQGKAPANGV